MSWHEQLILEAAGAGDGAPRLIPIGTATASNGAVLAGYVWSTGRVRATVHPGWLRIWRESGHMGDRVRLDPRRLTPGVQAIAEIWRRGERFGPLEGSLVGLRYQADGRFEVDATRRELRLCRKDGGQRLQRDRIERSPRANDHEMSLEPGEEGFVDALVDLFR